MKIQMIKNKITKDRGFAMLFTVLVMSLILTIAIGISNITFKQALLSSLAKDSQIAFYQADKGVECGLYYDFTANAFPLGTKLSGTPQAPDTIYCGNNVMVLDTSESYDDYFVYREDVDTDTSPCVVVTFDKSTYINGPDSPKYVVQSRGYNVCGENPRKVERALEVSY